MFIGQRKSTIVDQVIPDSILVLLNILDKISLSLSNKFNSHWLSLTQSLNQQRHKKMKNKMLNKKKTKMMIKTKKMMIMMMKIKVKSKEAIQDGKIMKQASFRQWVGRNVLTNCVTLRKFIRKLDQK